MIELEIPVEQIPYIRTIEGRKFHNGKWQFPDNSINKLIQLGLVASDTKTEPKKRKAVFAVKLFEAVSERHL